MAVFQLFARSLLLTDPLTPPADDILLQRFLMANHLKAGPPKLSLEQVARAFAGLPYENLSKIIREAETGSPAEARRSPVEVLEDHWHLGTGGTCFSLTAALLHLVRALGFPAEPILADRRYGPDTHCALLAWLDGRPHLLDPGYLIVRPIPLPEQGEVRLPTSFNEVVLAAREGGGKVDLHTIQQGGKTYRLTYRSEPADAGAFLRAWDASFAWDMMHYPVLTRVVEGRQLYLQGNCFQVRDRQTVQRCELDPAELVRHIALAFGLAPQVANRALDILRRRGDCRGPSSTS